jgi:ribosomal protein L11 methylase PrmA
MRHSASFRDPSGFIFRHAGVIYRQVNESYAEEYARLMDSGLYAALVERGALIPHEEVDPASLLTEPGCHRVLRPEPLPFVSYPYEWCFSQLKDAALLTLDVQLAALDHGQWLKDASAYNVQFVAGRPVFIDTLSFEAWPKGRPWVAYQQFCKQFLGPLALMAHTHVDLRKLLQVYIDGIPVEVTSRLLPWRTRLSFGLLTHIHMHASSVMRHQETDAAAKSGENLRAAQQGRGMSETAMRGLVDNLRSLVSRLEWKPRGTEWGDYYDATNYSDSAQESKAQRVGELIDAAAPSFVWDLGANTGLFSRIAANRGILTLACDIDPAAVEKNYRASREAGEQNILPLVMDLTNPTPDLGWDFAERMSLAARGPADLVMALALVHHLAISNNVPLPMLANFFRRLGRRLLIEWVPKSDSQVQRLLASREDIFPDYTREGFEAAFLRCFELRESVPVADSERILYLFE